MQHHVIIVVDNDADSASRLEEELLFMDETHVRVSEVDEWRDCCADDDVEALFVGPGVAEKDVCWLLKAVEQYDPDLPVVLVGSRKLAA